VVARCCRPPDEKKMTYAEKNQKKTESEWLMLLKQVPDNVFMAYFEDNPEMRWVAHDFSRQRKAVRKGFEMSWDKLETT
jgi:hypothetical protein